MSKGICGECTLCCYLFKIDELKKDINIECIHCNNGCDIYDERPDCCRGFNCAWLQVNGDIHLRPDKCKMIFEKINDHLFHGTRDIRFPITEEAKGQITSFIQQGFSVAIRDKNNTKIQLAKGHNFDDICDDLRKHLERRKNGSTIVHN